MNPHVKKKKIRLLKKKYHKPKMLNMMIYCHVKSYGKRISRITP